jgi:hypothetical protein
MTCSKCGSALESADAVCRCTHGTYVLKAEPGKMQLTGYPVGLVVEGPLDRPEGRRVDSRPASGGRAHSRTDSSGGFTAELSEPLDRGRTAEAHAISVLIKALCDRGDQVTLLSGSRDDHGEDALLSINGHQTPVQVVSLPADQSLWRQLSSEGTAVREGTRLNSVELVRQALLRKKGKAVNTLLVIDAAQLGAIISHSLVEHYRAAYLDPEEEFSLIEAWLVGPTARSAIRLGGRLLS